MNELNSVAVIGAGAWGTALAGVAARAGRSVTLYARSAASVARMKATHENLRLPGIRLEAGIDVKQAYTTELVCQGLGKDLVK